MPFQSLSSCSLIVHTVASRLLPPAACLAASEQELTSSTSEKVRDNSNHRGPRRDRDPRQEVFSGYRGKIGCLTMAAYRGLQRPEAWDRGDWRVAIRKSIATADDGFQNLFRTGLAKGVTELGSRLADYDLAEKPTDASTTHRLRVLCSARPNGYKHVQFRLVWSARVRAPCIERAR